MSTQATTRRARLPRGISYHSTSAGLKYRIRIRSTKKLTELGLTSSIDEIFDTLKSAEQRLIQLKYKKDEVKQEFYKKAIEAVSRITMKQLLEEVHQQYYIKTKTSKENKSRINVICNTLINSEDTRTKQIGSFTFTTSQFNDGKIPFGSVPVLDYENYLQAFIDSRKQKVKNQTIVNDLMIIHMSLKLGNKYFTSIPVYDHPLKSVNFKELKDQITYKNKRITPETRIAIEQAIIETSRKEHYHHLFVFLAETGVRISEALTILKKDCDLEKRVIFLVSKKNEKPRYIGITEKLYPIILAQIKDKKQTDKLFTHSKNTYNGKIKAIKLILKEKGIDFHYHMLRHTFISNMINEKPINQIMNIADINNIQHFQHQYINPVESEQIAIKVAKAQSLTPSEIKTVVGHSTLDMTIGTYTHTEAPKVDTQQLLQENNELKKLLIELLKKQSS